MNIDGVDVSVAGVVVTVLGGVGACLMYALRKPSDDARLAVAGLSDLTARQREFMSEQRAAAEQMRSQLERAEQGLARCHAQHDRCESRCADLEVRLARLETLGSEASVSDSGED